MFTIQNDNCSGQTISSSSLCTIDLAFLPASKGTMSAELTIPSDDPDTPELNVPLSGEGIKTKVDLPRTGQTTSYATGDDGHIQAGGVWPDPRFVDNGDGTMTDNLTGLMWLKDGSCFGKKKWKDALSSIKDFNINPDNYNCDEYVANYTDWHLPNINELQSLINYGEPDISKWLISQGFTNMQGSYYSYYWSSTTFHDMTSSAWIITLKGSWRMEWPKDNRYNIWPVRIGTEPVDLPRTGQTRSYATGDDGHIQAGVDWPDPRFVDNGDGTMTDNLTGLMWLKDGSCFGKKKWNDALSSIENFNINPDNYNCDEYLTNYTDWRLPNINEIESLINYGEADISNWLNSQGLTNVESSYYWSSTTKSAYSKRAGVVKFDGNVVTDKYKTDILFIWPVRAGIVNP